MMEFDIAGLRVLLATANWGQESLTETATDRNSAEPLRDN